MTVLMCLLTSTPQQRRTINPNTLALALSQMVMVVAIHMASNSEIAEVSLWQVGSTQTMYTLKPNRYYTRSSAFVARLNPVTKHIANTNLQRRSRNGKSARTHAHTLCYTRERGREPYKKGYIHIYRYCVIRNPTIPLASRSTLLTNF
jgi:hypothetical protein